jgi:hypothetical protein
VSGDLQNTRRWEPVLAPLQNAPGARSPEKLRAVLGQFDVAHNPRYLRTPEATYCNIFAWDASSALGAEIPHWIPDRTCPGGRRELNCNATLSWLEIVGPSAGWRELEIRDAAANAAEGLPTVALWKNPTGKPGHIAMLLPGRTVEELRIAQAGARNLFDAPLREGFGTVKPIRFFSHL